MDARRLSRLTSWPAISSTNRSAPPGCSSSCSLLFSATTIGIVYFGVQTGIERVARFSLPVLFGILVLLLVSTLGMSGSGQALRFIFVPRFAELEWEGVLEALGHAFFTLSVGMGTMITYGSYISRKHSIVKAAGAIVVLDTLIALLATIIYVLGHLLGGGGRGRNSLRSPRLIVDRIAEAGNLAAFRFFVNDFSTPTQLLAGHPDSVQKGTILQPSGRQFMWCLQLRRRAHR